MTSLGRIYVGGGALAAEAGITVAMVEMAVKPRTSAMNNLRRALCMIGNNSSWSVWWPHRSPGLSVIL